MKSFKILLAVSVLAPLRHLGPWPGGVGDNAQYGSWGDIVLASRQPTPPARISSTARSTCRTTGRT